jgi:putative ABC transport system ATP-binding protein
MRDELRNQVTSASPCEREDVEEWVYAVSDVGQTFRGRGGIYIESLRLKAGRSICILGQSGSGKSTLLHLLGGMLEPEYRTSKTKVEVKISHSDRKMISRDILKACRRIFGYRGIAGYRGIEGSIGFVFQQPFLLRDATCRLNLEMSLSAARRPINHKRIERLWSDLALEPGKLDARARTLSGGMQQRLAVGRAVIREPHIILADEPTANLDSNTATAIMKLLRVWQRSTAGRTLVFITHDVSIAARFADDIVVLEPYSTEQGNRATGQLLAGLSWPQPNPLDQSLISAWMNAEAGYAEKKPAKDRCEETSRLWVELGALPAEVMPTTLTDTTRRERFERATVWPRIAWAHIFNAEFDKKTTRQNLDNQKQQKNYGWSTSDWRLFPGALRNPRWGLAICSLLLFIWAAVLSPGLSREPIDSWSETLLFIFFGVIFLLPRLIPAMSLHAFVRSVGLFLFVVSGFLAFSAKDALNTVMEKQFRSPELHPLLAARAESRLTPTLVHWLQAELEKRDLVPKAGEEPSRRSVFGRYTAIEVDTFVPPATSVWSPPDCESERVQAGAMYTPTGLGISDAEQVLEHLKWEPVRRDQKLILRDLTYRQHLKAGSEAGALKLAGTGTEPTIFVSEMFLTNELRLTGSREVPNWLCLDVARSGEHVAFRVAAVIKAIPDFDKRRFSFILAEDVARQTIKSGAGTDIDYDLIAVQLNPSKRKEMLNFIRDPANRKYLSAEVGFKKLDTALNAAVIASNLGAAFAGLILAFGAFLVFVLASEFVQANRRELAVIRAFGGRRYQLVSVVIGFLAVPLAVALGCAVLFELLVMPSLVAEVTPLLDLGRESAGERWSNLSKVAFLASVILLVGGWFSVKSWFAATRSLASELQEVG